MALLESQPSEAPNRLVFAGCLPASDAYPNVKYRLQALNRDSRYVVSEVCKPVRFGIRYGSAASLVHSMAGAAASMLARSLQVCAGIVVRRRCNLCYVSYPAVPVLWLLSLVPRFLRPRRIVADAFISWYDTIVFDRRLIAPRSLFARCLRRVEARALGQAHLVIVDTPQNARHYADVLKLPYSRFLGLPLNTGFERIVPKPYDHERTKRLRVVYVGTLVPLHGLDALCDAIGQLDPTLPIDVEFYGDGQCMGQLERLLERSSRWSTGGGLTLLWQRDWQTTDALARIISDADLCIGILGQSEKAQRVWPYKNYLYLACGRALVTLRSPASRTVREKCVGPVPFEEIDPGDSTALAALLAGLAADKAPLTIMASAARPLFDQELSATAIAVDLDAALRGEA